MYRATWRDDLPTTQIGAAMWFWYTFTMGWARWGQQVKAYAIVNTIVISGTCPNCATEQQSPLKNVSLLRTGGFRSRRYFVRFSCDRCDDCSITLPAANHTVRALKMMGREPIKALWRYCPDDQDVIVEQDNRQRIEEGGRVVQFFTCPQCQLELRRP